MSLLLKILIVLASVGASAMGIRVAVAAMIVRPNGILDILGSVVALSIAFLLITLGLVGFYAVTSHGDIGRLFQLHT